MTDFLEKLKKGMEAENVPDIEQEVEAQNAEEVIEHIKKVPDQPLEEKPEAVMALAYGEMPKPQKSKKKRKRAGVKKNSAKKSISVEDFNSQEVAEADDRGLFDQNFGQLTVDVYQTDKDVVIRSTVAGVKPEELDITVEDDVVIIKGSRKEKVIDEEKDYFYQECYWGNFIREIILPVPVDNSRAEAKMEDGVLIIRIPKTDKEKKKKISIK